MKYLNKCVMCLKKLNFNGLLKIKIIKYIINKFNQFFKEYTNENKNFTFILKIFINPLNKR